MTINDFRLIEDFDIRPLDFSDAGNADRFANRYQGLLIYTDALGWLTWSGKVWNRDDHSALRRATDLTEDMLLDALAEYQSAVRGEAEAKISVSEGADGAEELLSKAKERVKSAKSYHAHALRSRGAARIRGMIELAVPYFVVKADELDADPFILNTPGGILDLRSLHLTKHGMDTISKYCTKITSTSPGSAGMELWMSFLNVITRGNQSLIGFLQQIAGMAAIGKVFHEGIILAYGSGRNGKSTFFNTLAAVLGDYAGGLDVRVLTTDRQNKGAALATLRGKRLILASELEEHQRLSSSTVKQLASTDRLVIEEKFRAPETVEQSHTLVLFTNHLPRVCSTDNGIWRRLTVVPFEAVIAEGNGTQNYSDILIKEAGSAILTWILQGARDFVNNDFKLDFPAIVLAATEEYRDRENWLENFINERCIRDANAKVGARTLYLAYKDWVGDAGEYVRRENDFSSEMVSAGFKNVKPKNKSTWVGLGLDISAGYGNPYAAIV